MKMERAGEVGFRERQHSASFVSIDTRDSGPPTYLGWDEGGCLKTLAVGRGILVVILLPHWIADDEYANK